MDSPNQKISSKSDSTTDTQSIGEGKRILQERWQSISKELPIRYPDASLIFGYGSGVVPQTGYSYSESLPLTDVIFVVEDMTEWHRKNYRMNRQHYRGNIC